MAFVKVLKNKAYCSRYQTKFRRRRQGKTDYYARKRLVVNDKDKYDSKKYRFVVRRTNKRIITSVVYSTLVGDMTVASADSKELTRYGVKNGLTNYAAAYCTGLLCARRLLKSKGLDKQFSGNDKVDGSYYSIMDKYDGDKRPFKAYLDVGLVRTTTGNRVFGAMKGACDGGLHIPHKQKRFPGFRIEKAEIQTGKRGKKEENQEKDKEVFTVEEHREHIFGIHVQEYYDKLKEEEPAKFKKQFSVWEKTLAGKSFEDVYTAAHKAIRSNPDREARKDRKVTRTVVTKGPQLVQKNSLSKSRNGGKWLREKRLSYDARKANVQKNLATIIQSLRKE
jgi:large subunit ribosomal protein L5e